VQSPESAARAFKNMCVYKTMLALDSSSLNGKSNNNKRIDCVHLRELANGMSVLHLPILG
jgi:hypothetical protein